MANSLAELRSQQVLPRPIVEQPDVPDTGIEDLMLEDILEAFAHLYKAIKLLDFLGDNELSGKIGQKERKRMIELSQQFKDYLDEVEPHYLEEEKK